MSLTFVSFTVLQICKKGLELNLRKVFDLKQAKKSGGGGGGWEVGAKEKKMDMNKEVVKNVSLVSTINQIFYTAVKSVKFSEILQCTIKHENFMIRTGTYLVEFPTLAVWS